MLGPRTLRLAGELADSRAPSMSCAPAAQAARANAIVDEAAPVAVCSPSAVRVIYNIGGEFTLASECGGSDEDRQNVEPTNRWVDVLTRLAIAQGIWTFVLRGELATPRLQSFIEDVAPAVRERVAGARAAGRRDCGRDAAGRRTPPRSPNEPSRRRTRARSA